MSQGLRSSTRPFRKHSRWALPVICRRNHAFSFALPRVPFAKASHVDISKFREIAFDVERPLVVKSNRAESSASLPAVARWFQSNGRATRAPGGEAVALSLYFRRFSETILPYELLYRQPLILPGDGNDDTIHDFMSYLARSKVETDQALGRTISAVIQSDLQSQPQQLIRFNAPLRLLIAGSQFNKSYRLKPLTQLYIAQAPLLDLPSELQSDVPPPDFVKLAGKGDIYDSSLWLGLEPTYTPWHRDPNPNYFCQLCSSKVIRLLPPDPGEEVFRQVQSSLGISGNSRIRGEEMMQGPERMSLHDAIWGPKPPLDIRVAHLLPGDSLFVPKGWWHSVKSVSSDGRLNTSVNWWFR